mmetsp:Transcript_21011/g.46073  ORF Transcript_21011/g.46073 Transcript_21011/m.46073 type:complete len:247 (-) Transcript_21011:1450-2190(-)
MSAVIISPRTPCEKRRAPTTDPDFCFFPCTRSSCAPNSRKWHQLNATVVWHLVGWLKRAPPCESSRRTQHFGGRHRCPPPPPLPPLLLQDNQEEDPYKRSSYPDSEQAEPWDLPHPGHCHPRRLRDDPRRVAGSSRALVDTPPRPTPEGDRAAPLSVGTSLSPSRNSKSSSFASRAGRAVQGAPNVHPKIEHEHRACARTSWRLRGDFMVHSSRISRSADASTGWRFWKSLRKATSARTPSRGMPL